MSSWRSLLRVTGKALLLLVVFNLILALLPADLGLGKISLYNRLFPGRTRFPFGETPQQSANLSLYDLEAMFQAHSVRAAPEENTYRVFLIGDSSVWGTLLRPQETLAGQLNQRNLQICGQPAAFYNLGYPTLSLTKDLMILERAKSLQPDLFIWLVTLESFLRERQLESPLTANSAARIRSLQTVYNLQLDLTPLHEADFWDRTLLGRRRAWADLIRLQAYGPMWAATGIDQLYPSQYTPPRNDFEADTTWQGRSGPRLDPATLSGDVLLAGMQSAQVVLVNEPIYRADGENSSLWYNFYYPVWAYDAYRNWLAALADREGWTYLDAWDAAPSAEFTNSAIHLTAEGESALARLIEETIAHEPCP